MTDQEINQTIAVELGWSKLPKDPAMMVQYTAQTPCGKWGMVPDYCNDLNAMADAEEWLVKQPTGEYSKTAYQTYDSALILYCGPRATARQRAENLLRVIGKWKEAS